MRLRLTFAFLLSFLSFRAVAQDDWARVGPPNAAQQRGQKLFLPNCSFCHGTDAAGKSGPDLLRSPLVNRDENGKQIYVVVHNGRNGKMPPFPDLTEQQVSDIAAFLHYRTKAIVARFSYKIQGLSTGDAKAGEAYFNGPGKCNTCHSPTGDLAGIAKKHEPPKLQHLFLAGYVEDRTKPIQVNVTLKSGEVISGDLVHLDEFEVALKDKDEKNRSFSREDVTVEVKDPLAAHQELLRHYTDTDIHNVFAYLETLK